MRMTENARRGPPPEDFSAALGERLDNAPADERVYRVALELTDPTRVSDIAARAECSKNAARRHLNRLADIGVLTKVTENPATFERNESYFAWRRKNRLMELSEREYKRRLGELLSEDEGYRETYGVDSPDNLDPLEYHDYGDSEQVWLDISNWEAIRTEIRALRQAKHDTSPGEGLV
ncbi:ArsR family transcriptional regulator [Haloferax sp. MBLA0078]|uniref:ArsR family transcriptional regulator n=2 Tax=Haloferacaceae TaxID=1644056 RepID=A0A6A8G851_9EURY|nr:helix-turn-helix transcriptional regulator [Haloferax sp. CBA1150]MRW97254.1 ArsR family transcriptional regulator [Haloferax marinum]